MCVFVTAAASLYYYGAHVPLFLSVISALFPSSSLFSVHHTVKSGQGVMAACGSSLRLVQQRILSLLKTHRLCLFHLLKAHSYS